MPATAAQKAALSRRKRSNHAFPEVSTWRFFFDLAAKDISTEAWMSNELLTTLQTLSNLERIHIPYKTLCRSIYDSDPTALYMALYRCLEALYAYSSSMKLKRQLSLTHDWHKVADALEESLSWYPREDSSLNKLISFASNETLEEICLLINSEPVSENVSNSAGKRIYNLRNAIVHYRPTMQKYDFDQLNWNKICECLAMIIFDVYVEIFYKSD
jgi:hypothetical protein